MTLKQALITIRSPLPKGITTTNHLLPVPGGTIDFVMMNGKDTSAVFWLGRPVWWMEYHKADKTGNKVWLEMPEQGIGGYATITAIKDCSHDTCAWKQPKGKHNYRPVIGKFQRWSNNVWDYIFDTGETIGATPEHPFYSLDRKAYIAIGDIKLQERIRTYSGKPAHLITKKKRAGREKVYNLEVHKDHNFFVGKSGLSVHNSYIIGAKDLDNVGIVRKRKKEVLDPTKPKPYINYTIQDGKISFKGLVPNELYGFVIMSDGTLKIGVLEQGVHFKLAEGKKIIKGAGTIKFNKEGKITFVDNSSGHYKPSKNPDNNALRT